MSLTGFASTDWYSGGPGNRALDQSAQSNSLGFRDRDYVADPPPGAPRIILLGDSFAWGAGVFEDNAIFPALLETKLNTAQHPVELLNASRKGAHTWKELDLYRRARTEFKPDIVVLVFFINDLETPLNSNLFDPLMLPALPWIPQTLREHTHLFHLLELRVRLLQERSGRRMDYAGYMRALYDDPDTLLLHERAMDYLHDAVTEDGAQLVIVNMPLLHQGKYAFDDATAHIRAQAARLHAPFIDLQPMLSKFDPMDIRVSRYDGHLNAKGHRIVADYLTTQLEPMVRAAAITKKNQSSKPHMKAPK
jgi:lysophospholipase L1-like esterase